MEDSDFFDDLEAHEFAHVLHALEVIPVEDHPVEEGHGVALEDIGSPVEEHLPRVRDFGNGLRPAPERVVRDLANRPVETSIVSRFTNLAQVTGWFRRISTSSATPRPLSVCVRIEKG
jgi:hypothetical protein